MPSMRRCLRPGCIQPVTIVDVAVSDKEAKVCGYTTSDIPGLRKHIHNRLLAEGRDAYGVCHCCSWILVVNTYTILLLRSRVVDRSRF